MNTGQIAELSKLSRRNWLIRSAKWVCASAVLPLYGFAAGDGIIRAAEAIHQEVFLGAKTSRIYEILTDAALFQQVALLSVAARGLDVDSHPAVIYREAGTAFSLFGNYIIGRQIELVPSRRIVQAWRVDSWAPGVYSIARFELLEHNSGTNLIFDHAGFPQGTAEHLATGWYGNYWDPLKKFLSS